MDQFFFLNIWSCHSISESHTLQALPHAIPSIPMILKIDKEENKLNNQTCKLYCLTRLILLLGMCVYVVLLFYLIAWTESYVFCWEKWTIFDYKKASYTPIINVPVFIYACSSFRSMHVQVLCFAISLLIEQVSLLSTLPPLNLVDA